MKRSVTTQRSTRFRVLVQSWRSGAKELCASYA